MKSLKNDIVGTWKLVSWTYQNEAGEEVEYFGKNSTGILMYDAHGYMNAQLMKPRRNKFVSDSISGGKPEETNEAFHSYLAYYGKYHEEQPGEIVHLVEGSLFPNWVGNRQVRYASIEGDRLIVSTPPIPAQGRDIVFRITWQRI
ncbi:MAG: lipocalin-like domain-containing protein [Bacteroidota bacterium]